MEPIENGCYVESGWGQYGTAHMIEQIDGMGVELPDDHMIVAQKHLFDMVTRASEFTDDDHEFLVDFGTQAEEALNDALPEGQCALWIDGEFYVTSTSELDENGEFCDE